MATPLTLPKLGVEMETARLVEWLAGEGEEIAAEQIVANVETEKVIFELPAPAAGRIHLIGAVDDEFEIGAELAVIAASAEEYESLRESGPAASPAAAADPAARDAVAVDRRGEPLASPLARRVAAAHNVSLTTVAGSGPRGTIRRRDVEALIKEGPAQLPVPQADRRPAPTAGEPAFDLVQMSGMRRTIASRMQASLAGSAQMTDIREQDVTAVVEMRRAAIEREGALGFRLTFTTIFAKAAVMALRAVPVLNGSLVSDDELRQYRGVNLGMAVSIPDGLVVPVVHDADRLSLRELDECLATAIARARDRSASAAEMSGGTFTLTNFGSYGSHMGTPILMPPQLGILGIGAMIDRPLARDGEVVIGKAMYSSLTVDHRVIDGETAGRFQTEFGRLLAEPDLLLYG